MLYSRRLVKPAVIIDTLRVTPGEDSPDTLELELDTILDICQNLIVFDSEAGALWLAHFLVQEFLIQHPEFRPELGYAAIAEVCLTFLLYQPKVEMSFTDDFMLCCSYFWGYHTRLSGGGSTMLERLWKMFLIPPLEPSPVYIEWFIYIDGPHFAQRGSQLVTCTGVIAPVFVACFYRLSNVTKFPLDSGGSLECRNQDENTPLAMVVKSGFAEFVAFLIGRNADLNPRNINGDTGIHHSCWL